MRSRRQPAIRFATFALVLATISTHTSDATIDRTGARFAAPGSFIWVGRHRLHLNCGGEGSPTVIFDSGLGGSSLDWVRVQSRVASFTRACSYDRAGYGWSNPGPRPRDSANISSELESLLGNASVPAPYVLSVIHLVALMSGYTATTTRSKLQAWYWWIRLTKITSDDSRKPAWGQLRRDTVRSLYETGCKSRMACQTTSHISCNCLPLDVVV